MSKKLNLDGYTPNIVTLSNGKKVGNFSSPHDFTFTDGTVLPAVSPDIAEALSIKFIEIDLGHGDILLDFDGTPSVLMQCAGWQALYKEGKVDVVFCPLPMMTLLRKTNSLEELQDSPFRAVRMEDRIKKLVSIDKQCL
jgi:hypothetical protein